MSTTPMPFPSPVTYPNATVGGRTYQFRYSKSAQFQLEKWGFELSPTVKIPALAWAAAMAGHVDPQGGWKSAGFRAAVEFIDTFTDTEDLEPLYAAVTEALKKAVPAATITLTTKQGTNEPNPGVN
jgi:hypothetical protein